MLTGAALAVLALWMATPRTQVMGVRRVKLGPWGPWAVRVLYRRYWWHEPRPLVLMVEARHSDGYHVHRTDTGESIRVGWSVGRAVSKHRAAATAAQRAAEFAAEQEGRCLRPPPPPGLPAATPIPSAGTRSRR